MATTTASESADDDNYYYYYYDYLEMTIPVQIPVGIGIVLLHIAAIGGNTMTIMAYITDKKKGNVYDFYIFQLALADLGISCISMPFNALYTLMNYTWPLGYTFCKVWLFLDFGCAFQTIMIMLLLSLDRLLLLTYGPHYAVKMTMTIARILTAITWIISFNIYGIAIIFWNHWVGYSTVAEDDCDVEFAYDYTFTTTTAMIEFVLPFVVMTSMNAVIFYKIRKRNALSSLKSVAPNSAQTKPSSVSVIPVNNSDPAHSSSESNGMNPSSDTSNKMSDKSAKESDQSKNKEKEKQQKPTQAQIQAKRELKSARLLIILVVAFLIMWAPYTICMIMIAFCGHRCMNVTIYNFVIWVLWMKSAINPLLYALNSSFYKKQFIRYLTCNGRIKVRQTERQS